MLLALHDAEGQAPVWPQHLPAWSIDTAAAAGGTEISAGLYMDRHHTPSSKKGILMVSAMAAANSALRPLAGTQANRDAGAY